MKTYVMGNWKMNLTVGDSSIYLQRLLKKIKPSRGLEIIIAPSAISLASLSLQLERNKSEIKLAAQNFYQKDFGAYTGEISIAQLRGVVSYALIGHSERRFIFGETNKDISQKVAAAIRSGITPVLCIGAVSYTHLEKTVTSVILEIRERGKGYLFFCRENDRNYVAGQLINSK